MDKKSFGKRMNKVRKERGLTADALAERCEIVPVYVRQIECASRLPSLPVFVKLCNSLSISPSYLLADSLQDDEQAQLNALWKRLQTLTPKQIDLASALIETLVDKMQEQE